MCIDDNHPLSSTGLTRLTNHGFTIIELMIVVTIISILLVISIPIYQSYSGRAQASEGLSLSGGLKQKIGEVKMFQGVIPGGGGGPVVANDLMGLPQPTSINGEYVESVTVWSHHACTQPTQGGCYPVDGTIEVQYKVATTFGAKKLALQPEFMVGAIKWNCAADTGRPDHISVQYRPPVCRAD